MPYRRLPNTDKARLKSLNIAFSKGKELPPFKLAFSQKSYHRLQKFLTSYENAMALYRQSYTVQTTKNNEYSESLRKAKIYISHFIQVMNMAILRGDLNQRVRGYYELPQEESRIPPMSTEKEIIKWGKKIIKGEADRVIEGGSPITNPTIALVKVRYETFLEKNHYQKTLQKNTERALENLTALREEADDIILLIWNEVEDSFKDLPDDLRREKAKDYGLVYVYRKNEIGNINFFKSPQTDTG